jgi:hypothetical protein
VVIDVSFSFCSNRLLSVWYSEITA